MLHRFPGRRPSLRPWHPESVVCVALNRALVLRPLNKGRWLTFNTMRPERSLRQGCGGAVFLLGVDM